MKFKKSTKDENKNSRARVIKQKYNTSLHCQTGVLDFDILITSQAINF